MLSPDDTRLCSVAPRQAGPMMHFMNLSAQPKVSTFIQQCMKVWTSVHEALFELHVLRSLQLIIGILKDTFRWDVVGFHRQLGPVPGLQGSSPPDLIHTLDKKRSQ